jgi:gluconolactonase
MQEVREPASGLRFPEGPVYLKDGSIALVEVAGGTVIIVGSDGSRQILAELGGGPNGIAVGPDGQFYICNSGGFVWNDEPGRLRPAIGTPHHYTGGRIDRLNPKTGEWSVLYDRCGDNLLRGPNDLVFDDQGGFYFTDLGKTRLRDRDHGGLYYASSDGSFIREIAYPLLTPNGVGLSPDQKVVYVAETETARLWAFDLDAPGEVKKHGYPSPHGGRLVCGLPGYQRFDSLAVEANGNICVSTLVTGRVTVISPAGRVVRTFETGDAGTTNICFGGEGNRTAFLTLSGTGRLVSVEWTEAGLQLAYEV